MKKSDNIQGRIRKLKLPNKKKTYKTCSNCRRRKVKCFGTGRCFNCIAHNYDCDLQVFTSSKSVPVSKPLPTKTKVYGNIQNRNTDIVFGDFGTNVSSLNSTSSNNNDKIPSNISTVNRQTISDLLNPAITNNTFNSYPVSKSMNSNNISGSIFVSSAIAEKNVIDNHTDNVASNKPNSNNFEINGHFRLRSNGQSNVGFSKYKNKGNKDQLKSNKDHVTLYKEEKENQKEYEQLIKTLKQLEKLPIENNKVTELIMFTRKQIEEIIKNWEPQLNIEKLSEFPKYGKSLETYLLKNEYVSNIFLTKFAYLNTNSINIKPKTLDKDIILSNSPLIDSFFGLYSVLEAGSLHGLKSLIQQYTSEKDLDKNVQESLRATLYIVMRIADRLQWHINQTMVSLLYPLELYLQRYGSELMCEADNKNEMISKLDDVEYAGFSNKILTQILIKNLPNFLTNDLIGISANMLLELVDQYDKMFTVLVDMLTKFYILLHALFLNIKLKDINSNEEQNKIFISQLKMFCDFHDIVILLTFNYFRFSLYRYPGFKDLDSLETMVRFAIYLEKDHYDYALRKVVVCAVKYAIHAGLGRWEYYVGLCEYEAERARLIWWELYAVEMRISISEYNGLSIINNLRMNCLLPEPFRRLGILNHKQFIENVESLTNDKILNEMSIDNLILYGKIGFAILVSNFYTDVLYSETYTNFKNIPKPDFVKENMAKEIEEQTNKFKKKLANLKKQLRKVYDCANRTYQEEPESSNDDIVNSRKFILIYCSYKSLAIRAVISLVTRLSFKNMPQRIKKQLKEYSVDIYECWHESTEMSMLFENAFEIWATAKYAVKILYLVASPIIIDYHLFSCDDLGILIKNFSYLFLLSKKITDLLNEDLYERQLLISMKDIFSQVMVLIRFIFLGHMRIYKMSRQELCDSIDKNDPSISYVVNILLDDNSALFNFKTKCIPASGYSLNVRRLLLDIPLNNGNSEDYQNFKLMQNSSLYDIRNNYNCLTADLSAKKVIDGITQNLSRYYAKKKMNKNVGQNDEEQTTFIESEGNDNAEYETFTSHAGSENWS